MVAVCFWPRCAVAVCVRGQLPVTLHVRERPERVSMRKVQRILSAQATALRGREFTFSIFDKTIVNRE